MKPADFAHLPTLPSIGLANNFRKPDDMALGFCYDVPRRADAVLPVPQASRSTAGRRRFRRVQPILQMRVRLRHLPADRKAHWNGLATLMTEAPKPDAKDEAKKDANRPTRRVRMQKKRMQKKEDAKVGRSQKAGGEKGPRPKRMSI